MRCVSVSMNPWTNFIDSLSVTELKNVCACHGICSGKHGIQGVFLMHFRDSTTASRPIFGKCTRMKLLCANDIFTPVTGRSVANVSRCLSFLPTSWPERKTSPLFNFSKIPPFYYSVAIAIAIVSLRERAKVRDTRGRFAALSRYRIEEFSGDVNYLLIP